MSRIDTHQSSKLTFAEGAAAATPASGLVHLYAKSDGLLYSKDDAGAESAVSGAGAGGSVATDTIWDAAGDLAVGSGADAASKLTKGAAGGVLAMGNGAVIWNAGTSFPASKATGDRYWRTDLGLEFLWDGTQWVSAQMFTSEEPHGSHAVALTSTTSYRLAVGTWANSYGIYLVRLDFSCFVADTNDGSKYYTATVKTLAANGTATTRLTASTAAGSPSTYATYTDGTGVAVAAADCVSAEATITKTSTPGGLYGYMRVAYRIIAT